MMRTSCFSKIIPKIHLPPSQPTPSHFQNQAKITKNKNPQTHRKQGEYKVPIEAELYVPGCGPRRGAQKVTHPWEVFFIPRDRGDPKRNSNKWGPWRPSWGGLRGPKTCDQRFLGEIIPLEILLEDFLIRPLSKKDNSFLFNVLGSPKVRPAKKKQ